MAWSAGVFTRALGASQWQTDATNGVGIQAGIHDTQDNDLASGINDCLNKAGQNTPTANLSMGGFAHTNVGAATLRTQYPQVAQIQDGFGVWCGTSGGSANAQTITPSPASVAYTVGQRFTFIAGFTNTAATTLNVSGLGTRTLSRPDGTDLLAGDMVANRSYNVVYVSTIFVLENATPSWNSYTPTVTTASGSLSSTSASAQYIKDLSNRVSFSALITTTLSGGPSSIIAINAPVTASNTTAAFGGITTVGGTVVGVMSYFNTTGSIYFKRIDSDVADWSDGALTINISGTYQGT
jgi:hypothetical protein